jgi:tetratricopeptide (TPR) repeat protein
LFAGALMAVSATAQTSGGIAGQIIGVDGKPLAKAKVEFTRTDVPGTYDIKTGKDGKFGYYTLPVGTFNVTVEVPGQKKPVEIGKSVRTKQGSVVELDGNLQKMQEQANAGMPPPPPGMTPEQAEAYQKQLKAKEAANKKLGQLNELLTQNKTYADAKQYDKAIAVMEQAVSIDQTHDVLFANLAEDYAAAKQYDKAADAYQKAIALAPDNASYVTNLGTVYAKEGKTAEANAAFAKAETLNPAAASTAMYNAAVIQLNAGNIDAASAAFDKLLAIDPNNADALYYKAICLLSKATADPKTGKLIAPPEAVTDLKKSLQIAPNGPNAATAKATLASLAN